MAKKEILNNDALTVRVAEDSVVETVLETAEKAVDATEQALEVIENQVERVVTITKNNPYLIAGAIVVGLGVGAFVGYKIAQKRLTAQFETELQEQIAAAKVHYRQVSKEGTSPEQILQERHPEAVVEAPPVEVVEAVRSYQGRGQTIPYDRPEDIPAPEPLEESVVVHATETVTNVFVQASTDARDWDYNTEIQDRLANPHQPYVISFDEYTQNEPGHEQVSLTYYAADDTLCDSREQPMDNVEGTVGDDNLQRFGDGSGDANAVYIRNENLDIDFEVIRSLGSYQQEVLSIPDAATLQHSDRSRSRFRRGADE